MSNPLDLNNLTMENIKSIDAEMERVKGQAVKNYVDGHLKPGEDKLYIARCFTVAIVNFIHKSGYELKKKEDGQ